MVRTTTTVTDPSIKLLDVEIQSLINRKLTFILLRGNLSAE